MNLLALVAIVFVPPGNTWVPRANRVSHAHSDIAALLGRWVGQDAWNSRLPPRRSIDNRHNSQICNSFDVLPLECTRLRVLMLHLLSHWYPHARKLICKTSFPGSPHGNEAVCRRSAVAVARLRCGGHPWHPAVHIAQV